MSAHEGLMLARRGRPRDATYLTVFILFVMAGLRADGEQVG